MLDFSFSDPVDVGRRFILLVKVFELPHVLQHLVAHQFVGVLCVPHDLVEFYGIHVVPNSYMQVALGPLLWQSLGEP